MSDVRVADVLRLRLRESQIFLALSIIIGILAGLAAVLFSLAIDRTDYALFGLAPSPLRTFFVPVLVSLGTGVLLATVFGAACEGATCHRRRSPSIFREA